MAKTPSIWTQTLGSPSADEQKTDTTGDEKVRDETTKEKGEEVVYQINESSHVHQLDSGNGSESDASGLGV